MSLSTAFRSCTLVSVLALAACRGEQVDVEHTGDASESGVASESGIDSAGSESAVDGDDASTLDSSSADTAAGPADAALDADAGTGDADAGTGDGDAGTGDAAPTDAFVGGPKHQADCPIARGPKMKFIAAPEPFCIDETEVTDAQLNVFVIASDKPAAPKIPAFCATALAERPPKTRLSLSVAAANIEWCVAYAYCKWAGKRLCGKHGGGAYSSSESEASGTSQWSYACRGGDPGTVFPYGGGAAYVADTCINEDSAVTSVQPVNSSKWPDCHGSGEFSTLMHMAGNAREWEDACDGPIGASTSCRTRGGAWTSPWNETNCGSIPRLNTNADATTGFRCCYDGR
ncbi:MAG: SUMF1/EgtB/PvdO family nonheme iron enzyme [Deltaproteobacteria bacterium]|nr:SUMF1/EgtB/PvdO family nonheme iron enzyme [Deltaproteobacteria bacterium]